jgi:hypothetical protein
MRDGAEVEGGANGEVCLDSLLTLMTRLKIDMKGYQMVDHWELFFSTPCVFALILSEEKYRYWYYSYCVVPHLSDDERELLMTGITHEEWNCPVSEAAQQD